MPKKKGSAAPGRPRKYFPAAAVDPLVRLRLRFDPVVEATRKSYAVKDAKSGRALREDDVYATIAQLLVEPGTLELPKGSESAITPASVRRKWDDVRDALKVGVFCARSLSALYRSPSCAPSPVFP